MVMVSMSIRPVCSASPMNRSGKSSPCTGCCQRTSASSPGTGPVALRRLGRESRRPLEPGGWTRNEKAGLRGSLPAPPASFLALDGDGIEWETLKPAEDGEGYIVRLLETSGREGKAHLSSRL